MTDDPARPAAVAPRRATLLQNLLLMGAAIALALAVLDVALIVTGLLPPRIVEEGDPAVGWLGARPTGRMERSGCAEPATGRVVRFPRNEDGVRTAFPASELRQQGGRIRVAVGGDSHTELCVENERTHFGFTERTLDSLGVPSAVYAYGAGKYSPLQAYLALAPTLDAYAPEVLVLNLYTGNDFYDMLRVDDRPHFVRADSGYALAPPIWYQSDPPGVRRRSRVLHALRLAADATGIRRVWVRIRYLLDAAAEQGQGPRAVLAYMSDLRRATVAEAGYPQAFAAQMLNQQLFFHHFPGSEQESIRRVEALLRMIRHQRPHLRLLLSPVPSYQLVLGDRPDSLLARAVSRLPISVADGVRQEEALYDRLREAAGATGWVFVDNLALLRAEPDPSVLYNHFDYHIEPVASERIGAAQARAIRDLVRTER